MNLNDQVNDEIVDEHVNYRWVNRDPNEITELIETVKNDYQSDIILSLFTNLANKMYLVDHRNNVSEIEIDLLGSKRNNSIKREKYTVIFNKINSNFTCNCKDFTFRAKQRDIVCKHITFIICKVLGIYDHTFFETKKLSLAYQKRMTRILNYSNLWNNNEISVKHINSEFNKNTKRVLNTDDQCPICCDAFGNKETISCPSCQGYIHKNCMDVWIETSKTCVYCRSMNWSNYIKDISKI